MAEHFHANTDRLHFGCAACRERAIQDQLAAEVADAARRQVTVIYSTLGTTFEMRIELRWPRGWRDDDVVTYYTLPDLRPQIRTPLDKRLVADIPVEDIRDALDELHVNTLKPGPWIRDDSPRVELEGQQSMFG